MNDFEKRKTSLNLNDIFRANIEKNLEFLPNSWPKKKFFHFAFDKVLKNLKNDVKKFETFQT